MKRLLQIVKRQRARYSAMLLLVCVFLPFAQASIGSMQDREATLPACCRLHGKHQCSSQVIQVEHGQQTAPALRHVSTLSEKCPCLPPGLRSQFQPLCRLLASHGPRFPLFETRVAVSGHASVSAIDSQGGHQKRGPPSILANS